ncbi:phosphotransferase family protein [Leptospira sp. 96542]|nr:phosphotransferase family protein [Leptospira sp. 96542]
MELNDLQSKVEEHLATVWSEAVQIKDLVHLSGGACQDNYSLSLKKANDQMDLVLRTDKGGSLLSSLSKRDEFKVAQLVFGASVKTPKPILLEENPNIIGAPFFLMEKIKGKATGRYITKDKELDAYRKSKMVSDLASNLAKLHTIKPSAVLDETLKQRLQYTPKESYIQKTLNDLKTSLDDLPEAHPAIELCLLWMEEHIPNIDEIVLVHGDFRTGNFMMDVSGLQGILDFEFAHFGDRHEDIAWLCMRDWRFGRLNKEVGGFGDRKDFYAEYEKTSGIPVDSQIVSYYEVLGNLRWAIGSAGQAERHLSGKDKGIELAAIGRRTAEMEWEAMRIIEELDRAI